MDFLFVLGVIISIMIGLFLLGLVAIFLFFIFRYMKVFFIIGFVRGILDFVFFGGYSKEKARRMKKNGL